MFKRKQDVDKHVLSVLNRKKDEKERNAQGYQIARLYLDIKEYETAKRYLANFLHVRENSPQAHQLMGEINEALGKKDLAIDNFKRALDLGGFGSANRQLVLKICELYCDLGTDDQRMKYWLQKCEELFPQSEIVYRMKSKLVSSSSNGAGDNVEMENLILAELMNRPTDLDLRIKLLQLYLDMNRIEEAYDAAVDTDLTTAFVDSLPWYECMMNVFEKYSQHNPDSGSDVDFILMNMHMLRNATILSLPTKPIQASIQVMKKFDEAVKHADSADIQEEWWLALLKEMKGQLLYLVGLVLIKRAMMGSIPWQEVNQLSGACFLVSRGVSPLDAQSPWFVKPRSKEYVKFYNYWHLQSYDRLSQVGHMIQQLSKNVTTDWSRTVYQQVMTGPGHKRLFEAVFTDASSQEHANNSFFYSTNFMTGQIQEPLTSKQLLDIDRVAYQTHLGKLSHLVWLCLQRYSPNMECQPNYHFSLMENIQFSVNMEKAGSEQLCQLDVLTFLLASVRAAASSISENVFSYEDQSGRPTLLPVCLSQSLCTPELDEWWSTAFRFCSNTVKDNFSRLRRVLVRGVEVIRLKGSHGVSIPMQCHLARCLDAKIKSLRESEFGCRCSAAELAALEARAFFYWQRAYTSLQKVKKNQHPPLVKNRLFKEAGDGDLAPRLVDKHLSEAEFATAVCWMGKGQLEDALELFERHPSPWASFRSAQIHRSQANECLESEKHEMFKALIRKSRDLLYKTQDRLKGDKSHELYFLVRNELDDLEIEIQRFDWDENDSAHVRDSFITPSKSASNSEVTSKMTTHQEEDESFSFTHSTPRPAANGISPSQTSHVDVTPSTSRSHMSHASPHPPEHRPSPQRLDSQIKSLGYSQTTLFKMVLDRNEDLLLIHSRMMEEHRNHNNLLQTALQENKKVMEDLKTMLIENKDMLKSVKTELASLKSAPPPLAPPNAIPAGPPLIVAASHLAPASARGAYPGFPPPAQTYSGYLLNSPIPPPPHAAAAGPNFRASGLPGSRSSQVGKFKTHLGVGEEEEEEDEDLEHTVEDLSAMCPEYYADQDQSYSQYFTPESHMPDWSLRSSGMEPQAPPLPVSPAIQPTASRMAMPQPGFFASALRGQSLQYTQQPTHSPASVSSKPGGVLGPGFFSSSVATLNNTSSPSTQTLSLAGPAENASALTPSAQGNIPIFSAMSSDTSTSPSIGSSGGSSQHIDVKDALTVGQNMPSAQPMGVKILFHIKASMPAKNATGALTILMTANDSRAMVIMMSDSEEMLFQHDVSSLRLHPAIPGTSAVTWTASKIGLSPSLDIETVTVFTLPESMGNLLRDALQKTAASASSESGGSSAVTPGSSATPGSGQATFGKVTPTAASTAPSDGGKTEFGGFSFSSTPVLTPVHTENEKATPHKGVHTEREKATPNKRLTSPVKITEAANPFAGVSLSVPKFTTTVSPGKGTTTQAQVFPQKSPGGREVERVDEYEPNVEFKPIIPLPELVEKKTGEENETAVFVDRCRLFRYDVESRQWKERGVGELKILCDNKDHRYRVVMRRDQILKLCANHFISANMNLSPLANSDKTWCYSAMDYSDEEMKVEQLALRFKNQEKAKRFKDVFEGCVDKIKKEKPLSKSPGKGVKEAADSTTSLPVSKPVADTTSTATTVSSTTSSSSSKSDLSQLFKPKPGSWECDGCLCRNQADQFKCPACGKVKPGAKPADAPSPFSSGSGGLFSSTGAGGGFRFGVPSTSPNSGLFGKGATASASTPASSAAATTAAKPASTTTSAAAAAGAKPLSELFKPKAGTWECDGCLCRNQADQLKCPACGKMKPGAKPEDVVDGNKPSSGAGSFTFGAPSGFVFGSPAASQASTKPGFSFGVPAATVGSTAAASTSTGTASGFKFPLGGNTTTSATTDAAPTTGGFKFGASSTTAAPFSTPTTTTATGFGFPGGFKFGAAKGDTTSTPKPSAAAPSTTTPAASIPPTSTPKETPSKGSTAGTSESLLASLLTADESKAEPTESQGFNFTMAPAVQKPPADSGSSGFQFSFQKSPGFATPSSKTSSQVPKSPEVDEQGLYVTKEGEDSHIHFEPIVQLPDKVETKTGEEDEKVLFESRARMYRFVSGEWKEKGIGVMKVLEHKQTKKSRVLMRRDQVLKICCNHIIKSDMDLQPMPKMEGKAWLWVAMDFSEEEGSMEKLAVRFKKPETAQEFKDVFDRCSGAPAAVTTPKKGSEPQGNESDDDVIFVKEKKSPAFIPKITATTAVKQEAASVTPAAAAADEDDVTFVKEEEASPEQKALAAKYKLPANFYLYEKRKPCKGCLGCTDGEGLPPFASARTPKKDTEPVSKPKSYADAAKSPTVSTTPTPAPGDDKSQTTTPTTKSIFGTNNASSPGTIGKSIFGSGATLEQTSLFGSPVSTGGSPSIFGGSAKSTTDFSSLTKGSNSATTSASASPFSTFTFGAGSSTPDFSSLAASGGKTSFLKKADTGSPFKFEGAGQKLFGRPSGGEGGGDGAEGEVAPSSDVHFEPIIPLPDLVEVKTGEEDWSNIFSHRAKLFKFDRDTKQWKERGVGDIKIMTHSKQVMFRILQRREQVLKVSCNHLITKDMNLNPMSNSESSWCWVATDLSDEGSSIEQFAVKFKNKEMAIKFKAVFEDCQEKLRNKPEAGERREQKEIVGCMSSTSIIPLGEVVEDMTSVSVTPLGDRGNMYHSQALDVSGQDRMTSTSCVPLQQGEVIEDMNSVSVITPLGDRGNVYHSQALDVSGQDRMTSTSCVPLQQGEVIEDMTSVSVITPLGDRGNMYHSQALDVGGQDRMTSSSCVPLQQGEVIEDMTSVSVITPLGDRGNMYHSQALDVSGRDRMTSTSCVPLQQGEVIEDMTSVSVTPLGDRGNMYHSQALDVSGQDRMTSTSCVPLQQGEVIEDMTSVSVTPLGDRGNMYHSQALDVSGRDRMTSSSCVPLQQGEVIEDMTSVSVTPLGDRGNMYHSQALDVSGRDRMTSTSCVPLHQGEVIEDTTSVPVITPLGDRGNVYHSQALDVSGQDRMTSTSCVPLQQGEVIEDMTSVSVITSLGDRGNMYHSQALDVSGQDRMTSTSCVPLQQGEVIEDMTSVSVTPLGDRGNMYHSQALDVSGQDRMTSTSCVPLQQGEVIEDMTSVSVTPLGDRGNVYHSQALDVSGQDRMTSTSCVPLQQGEVIEDMTSVSVITPLGDRGNMYLSQALDVSGQDRMTSTSCVPLQQGEVIEDMTSVSVTPLGDRGNMYLSQALDVSGQDRMTSTSCVPLQQGEVIEDMTSVSVITPLGDRGNMYHSHALDVSGQDRMTATSCVPLQQGEVIEDMTSVSVTTPLGDRGNMYHSHALDVSGQDRMTATSCVPLQQGEVIEDMSSVSVTPLGDRGNMYHSKALDVGGQDRMTSTSCVPLQQGEVIEDMTSVSVITPLGDRGNMYHSQALDISVQDRMTSSSCVPLQQGEVIEDMTSVSVITPLGDRGNMYHSQALDISVQDRMTSSSCVPLQQGEVIEDMTTVSVSSLGDRGNMYHSQALDVSGQDRMTSTSCVPLQQGEVIEDMTSVSVITPLGDRGNMYHSQALDVSGQDRMTSTSCVPLQQGEVIEDMTSVSVITPLGDRGNMYHSHALDVSGQDRMTSTSCVPLQQGEVIEDMTSVSVITPLGDRGNMYHSQALDVGGQDRMTSTSCVPLQQGEVIQDVTSVSVTPLGNRGNMYHSQALDVSGQDRMTSTSCVPLQQGEVIEDMTSVSVTPLGDRGNMYHSQALEVSGQDRMTSSSCVPLQQGEVIEDMTSVSVTPLGDRGNMYHSQALDVSGQDRMTSSSCVPLLQGEVIEDMTSVSVTPLGDRGNMYHSQALDVSGQDRMTSTSCVPLQQGEVIEDMTSVSVTPLGDRGNMYHSQALEVSGQDRMTSSSCVPLQQGEVIEDMTSVSVTPLGDRGNMYHSQALDVSGQDRMTSTSCVPLQQGEVIEDMTSVSVITPLGDRGNMYHSQALDVSGQDRMTSTSCVPLQQGEVIEDMTSVSVITPLGDRGNMYHSQALDVGGQDRMTSSSCVPLQQGEVIEDMTSVSVITPLGDRGNMYHSQALDVSGQDRMTSTSCVPLQQGEVIEDMTSVSVTPLGDRGNVYHSQALDVSGQDRMTSTSCVPLQQGEVIEDMTSVSVTPLGDRGNVYHSQALDVGGQDRMTAAFQPKTSPLPPSTVIKSLKEVQSSKHSDILPRSRITLKCREVVPDLAAYCGLIQQDDEDDEIIFEKRATLSSYKVDKWQKLGIGQLCVKYNEDLNGNSVNFSTDAGERLCSHIICREHDVKLDPKSKSCEWKPIDYSTDEPIRRHFGAGFSSLPAAEEFVKVFREGKRLAMDSDLSENLPTDIEVPEVFSCGEAKH